MSVGPSLSRSSSRLALIGLWLLTCAWLLVANQQFIGPMNFRDPDDALRLVQVRDLLAGQSWFDLTQYRIHPPAGVPMHWSRLVDLPIALMLGALEPMLGQPLAERVTLVAIPLGQLLVLFGIVYALCRRLGLQRATALLGAAMLGTSVSILIQFAPVRIDHHGMQILFGGLAMLAVLRPDRRDGLMGALAGLAMAGWLQVSMEGLPTAVAIGIVFSLRTIWYRDRHADLPAYLLALTGFSALLLFATHYPGDALRPWCDAMSPSYLLPLSATTITLLVAHSLLSAASRPARAVPLALAGLAGATAFLALSRQCLAGPFDSLDPLTYTLWYRNVREGLPFYAQKADMQALIIVPALIALPGSLLGLRQARTETLRLAWLSLLFMQIVTFALALDVMRAMSFAHVLALPGNAVLLATLMRHAQRLRLMPLRVVLTAVTAVLTPFGAASVATAALDFGNGTQAKAAGGVSDRFRCTTWATLRGLDALPAATLFTPLDIGAHMLVYTHHSVVATGHHRNVAGMKAALEGLLATPDEARAIVVATGARYVAYCRGENEVVKYRQLKPNSLIAALMDGKTPGWLRKVPMRPGETIEVYRIL